MNYTWVQVGRALDRHPAAVIRYVEQRGFDARERGSGSKVVISAIRLERRRRGFNQRSLQGGEEEEEERDLIKDLKRHGRLAVAWDPHGSPVPRWTLTRYGLDWGQRRCESLRRDQV